MIQNPIRHAGDDRHPSPPSAWIPAYAGMTTGGENLPALGFSFLRSSDRTQCVYRGDSSDGSGGEAGLQDFAVGAECKIGRVDDTAPFFPIGADAIGVFWNLQSITDGKSRAGALDHFFGFIERVDG